VCCSLRRLAQLIRNISTPKSGTPLSRMRIIDAIAIDAADETRRRRRAERTDDDESEMAKLDRRFADMLGDYLAGASGPCSYASASC
jgi:hypothetical protein